MAEWQGWPVTVFKTRHDGKYELGASWVALPCEPCQVPYEALGPALICSEYWEWVEHSGAPVGRGKTAEEALQDLHRVASGKQWSSEDVRRGAAQVLVRRNDTLPDE